MTLRSALQACLCCLAIVGSAAHAGSYTVKPGDTQWRIASANGMTVEQLRKLNHLGAKSALSVGQTLVVQGATPSRVASAETAPRKPAQVSAANKSSKVAAGIKKTTANNKSTANNKTAVSAAKPAVAGKHLPPLASSSALVVDASTGRTLYAKNTASQMPIASITKLMTAMVVLDSNPSMQESLTIGEADVDNLKHTTSRLPVGTRLSRYEMLRLALMSSENRAASSLSRHYPGGKQAFVSAMQAKAGKLGMGNTRFYDPTGLTPANVSTAEDLVKMVKAASQYSLIHEFTTTPGREVAINNSRQPLEYKNTNRLVRNGEWDIAVSKTGYINEAGHCLVMLATVANRPSVMVFLEAEGKLSAQGDASRLKNWLEANRNTDQLAMLDP